MRYHAQDVTQGLGALSIVVAIRSDVDSKQDEVQVSVSMEKTRHSRTRS